MSAVMPGRRMLAPAWRLPLVVTGGVLVLLLWLYWGSFAAMEAIWARSGTFAHAYLVPPIVVWLIWRERDFLALLTPRVQPWTLPPMVACGLAWLIGEMAGVNAITQLAATALLVLAVPALLGWPVARAIAFPLGFLFFMVPIGEFVMPTMMEWTADVTVFVLRAAGLAVYREGLQFIIPSGSWSVVEACSGVRYLIASFMVGTLFAYLNYTSITRRLLFCLVAIAVPIVANWARAVMIVTLGHLSGNKLAVGVDHLVYGWVFFGVVIGLMFFIGSRWTETPDALPSVARGATPRTVADAGIELWVAALLTVMVLGAPPMLAYRVQSTTPLTPTLELPELIGTARAEGAAPLHKPVFLGPRAQTSAVYREGQREVTVHVAYYRHQTFGKKLVNSQNMLVESEDTKWRRTAGGSVQVMAGGQPTTLRMAELSRGHLNSTSAAPRLQVRQIYWVGGRLTASDHLAVLYGVFGQLSGSGDDGAAITFYMAGEADDAGPALDAFVARHLGALAAWLQVVRADR